MFDDPAAITEYELEREKWSLEQDPNIARNVAKKKSGCGGCLTAVLMLFVSMFILKAILEFFSFFL